MNHGAPVMMSLRLIDWNTLMGLTFDGFMGPQICMPYDHTGLTMALETIIEYLSLLKIMIF